MANDIVALSLRRVLNRASLTGLPEEVRAQREAVRNQNAELAERTLEGYQIERLDLESTPEAQAARQAGIVHELTALLAIDHRNQLRTQGIPFGTVSTRTFIEGALSSARAIALDAVEGAGHRNNEEVVSGSLTYYRGILEANKLKAQDTVKSVVDKNKGVVILGLSKLRANALRGEGYAETVMERAQLLLDQNSGTLLSEEVVQSLKLNVPESGKLTAASEAIINLLAVEVRAVMDVALEQIKQANAAATRAAALTPAPVAEATVAETPAQLPAQTVVEQPAEQPNTGEQQSAS